MLSSARIPAPVTVLGLGEGGRCAPVERGHREFAAATPGCRYVVLSAAGHADVLDGWPRQLAGRLCRRGAEPDVVRRAVTEILLETVAGPPGAS